MVSPIGVGDIIAVSTLAWNTYLACNRLRSSKQFQELAAQCTSVHIAIKTVQSSFESSPLLAQCIKQSDFDMILNNARGTLEQLQEIVKSYSRVDSQKLALMDRIKFSSEDLTSLRSKLTVHMNTISIFADGMQMHMLVRIEERLQDLTDAVRRGAKKTSLLCSQGSATEDSWQELRSELLADGRITEEALDAHRDVIEERRSQIEIDLVSEFGTVMLNERGDGQEADSYSRTNEMVSPPVEADGLSGIDSILPGDSASRIGHLHSTWENKGQCVNISPTYNSQTAKLAQQDKSGESDQVYTNRTHTQTPPAKAAQIHRLKKSYTGHSWKIRRIVWSRNSPELGRPTSSCAVAPNGDLFVLYGSGNKQGISLVRLRFDGTRYNAIEESMSGSELDHASTQRCSYHDGVLYFLGGRLPVRRSQLSPLNLSSYNIDECYWTKSRNKDIPILHEYVRGGCASLWRLSFNTETAWTKMPCDNRDSPGTVRNGQTIVAWKDYLLLFGGMTGDRAFALSNDLWKLKLKSNGHVEAIECNSMTISPPERHGHAATVIGDFMYISGGLSTWNPLGDNTPLLDLWRFHIPTDLWTEIDLSSGPTPQPRQSHILASRGTVLCLLGGFGYSLSDEEYQKVYELDTANL